MGWTVTAIVLATLSATAAIAAGTLAYIGREREDTDRLGFFQSARYAGLTLTLTIAAALLAALSALSSGLASLADS
ncbi:hypothetical protein GCM10022200_05430 [Microbacterium awajiense]|uniref:Uncharacterized protein n=1 Tax=Microbacterium awajiense TaxID=415214 RepID=A0ABP7A6Y3_9MICO